MRYSQSIKNFNTDVNDNALMERMFHSWQRSVYTSDTVTDTGSLSNLHCVNGDGPSGSGTHSVHQMARHHWQNAKL